MDRITLDSWLKIGLPAYPALFTIFGAWLYWGDNPVSLLAPPIAFWGLVVLFYLFSHLYTGNRYPLALMITITVLWLVSAATSHSLGKFVASNQYKGFFSVMSNINFWYAYICAAFAALIGLSHFVRYEPLIVEQIQKDRASIQSGVA